MRKPCSGAAVLASRCYAGQSRRRPPQDGGCAVVAGRGATGNYSGVFHRSSLDPRPRRRCAPPVRAEGERESPTNTDTEWSFSPSLEVRRGA